MIQIQVTRLSEAAQWEGELRAKVRMYPSGMNRDDCLKTSNTWVVVSDIPSCSKLLHRLVTRWHQSISSRVTPIRMLAVFS